MELQDHNPAGAEAKCQAQRECTTDVRFQEPVNVHGTNTKAGIGQNYSNHRVMGCEVASISLSLLCSAASSGYSRAVADETP